MAIGEQGVGIGVRSDGFRPALFGGVDATEEQARQVVLLWRGGALGSSRDVDERLVETVRFEEHPRQAKAGVEEVRLHVQRPPVVALRESLVSTPVGSFQPESGLQGNVVGIGTQNDSPMRRRFVHAPCHGQQIGILRPFPDGIMHVIRELW